MLEIEAVQLTTETPLYKLPDCPRYIVTTGKFCPFPRQEPICDALASRPIILLWKSGWGSYGSRAMGALIADRL